MAEIEELGDLALDARTGAFVRVESEAAFRAWQRKRSRSMNATARVSGLGGLLLGAIIVLPLRVPHALAWLILLAVLATVSLATSALPARWSLRRSIVSAGINGVWGVSLVCADVLLLDAVELSVLVATTCAFWVFTLTRTRPRDALLAAATYLSLDAFFVVRAMDANTLPPIIGVTDLALMLAVLVAGVRSARRIDVQARHTFRYERTIEVQRATIAHQQELLRKELSHQVAERSRELGAWLANSDVAFDARRLSPNDRFAERYRIARALGAGGMGAVYEVERVTDGARLALKVVVGAVSSAAAARFAREAEIGARVHHQNLVSIVDVGVSAGVPFLVMECVEGGSLEAQRAKFGDVAWALPILKQIAEGLAALHEAGVVHRDLKPANVLLAGDVAKISDFGISRFGSLDDGAPIDAAAPTMAPGPKRGTELTGTGVIMGTPLYMPPEAARSARALDASADVFALGILAYEMLAGSSPFSVPAFALATAAQPIPIPPGIDAAGVSATLRAVLVDALAADPARRPNIRNFVDAMRTEPR